MKLNHVLVLVVLMLFVGCVMEIFSFEQGISEMKEINEKHGIDFKGMPAVMGNAVLLRNDLKELQGRSLNAPESFKLFLDYKIKSLEANIIHIEGWKNDRKSTTKYGFGCKSTQIVINSSKLRNFSAQKGYESLEVLKEFIDKYPEEAESISITQKDVLFSNAYYYEVEAEASRDRKIIESLCLKDKEDD